VTSSDNTSDLATDYRSGETCYGCNQVSPIDTDS
jgi:hypothetical protein